MNILISSLLVIGAAAIIVAAGAIIFLFVWNRRPRSIQVSKGTEKSSVKGLAEKVKKTVALHLPWFVTLLAVAGGWLFFLLSLYVLLPSVWQWLITHPEFFWMPPLVIFATQALYASKKDPAKYLAHAIILVLLIAFMNALPWWWRSGGDGGASTHPAAEQAMISATTRWRDCIELPFTTSKRTDVVKITAPVGVPSPCYRVRNGYWFRISPPSLVKIAWHDGRVQYDSPKVTTHLGDSVRNAAFVITSLEEKPAIVVVWFTKK